MRPTSHHRPPPWQSSRGADRTSPPLLQTGRSRPYCTVIGQDIEILSVAATNGRQELIATCHHAGRRHQIALLDIHITADRPASRLLAAYRHWTGAENPGT
ncbi:MAG: hypothetical protein LC777_10210 [Actinobacteria bacterium]|nr:hypothetical protein [Actinomycetota bacterium]